MIPLTSFVRTNCTFESVWRIDTMLAVLVCSRSHGGGAGAETRTSHFQLLSSETSLLLQFALIHRCNTHTKHKEWAVPPKHLSSVTCSSSVAETAQIEHNYFYRQLKIAGSDKTSPLKEYDVNFHFFPNKVRNRYNRDNT